MSRLSEYLEAASLEKKASRLEAKKWHAPSYKKTKYDSSEEEAEIKKLLSHLKDITSISYDATIDELIVESDVDRIKLEDLYMDVVKALNKTPYANSVIYMGK